MHLKKKFILWKLFKLKNYLVRVPVIEGTYSPHSPKLCHRRGKFSEFFMRVGLHVSRRWFGAQHHVTCHHYVVLRNSRATRIAQNAQTRGDSNYRYDGNVSREDT